MRGFSLALASSLLIVIAGCGREGDTKVIDFSRTVEVSRPDTSQAHPTALRVAVAAMISPKESFVYYRELLDFLGDKLNRKILLVQRKTYREIDQLLGNGSIDIAFICSGPYAAAKDQYGFQLVAAPVVAGSHSYHSYLIVNASSPYKDLKDLKGKSFAFTDQASNTGRLTPLHWLAQMGEQPEGFFQSSIFTYSHDNSIVAVAKGLVDGAAVDSLVWERFNHTNPEVTERTRVIGRSEPYGIPPVVSSSSLPRSERDAVQQALLTVHEDPAGRRILNALGIDRFVEPRDEWYDSLRVMIKGLPSITERENHHDQP
jgi:phosphonate transport system substrate-binding protein